MPSGSLKKYIPRVLGDIVKVGTMDIRPLPRVIFVVYREYYLARHTM
jgi:hypothetical protein